MPRYTIWRVPLINKKIRRKKLWVQVIEIRNEINKNFQIGRVQHAVLQTAGTTVLSSSGTYVTRSLKGIENKLKDTASNAESSKILVDWLGKLSNDKSIPNHEGLIIEISAFFVKK